MAGAITRWLRSRLGSHQSAVGRPSEAQPDPSLPDLAWSRGSAEPDAPLSFGAKINWFAVHSDEAGAVAQALSLASIKRANWESGLAAASGERRAYDEPLIFITPPIDGWTLVIGGGLPYPNDLGGSDTSRRIGLQFRRILRALADRFDDVQFFGNHRVPDFAAWARAKDGVVVRVFSWVGAEGAVLANEGPQSVEERRLGLLELSGCDLRAAADQIFERMKDYDVKASPDEEDVVSLAGHWSIDPSVLENRGLPLSVGLVGRLVG